MLAVGAVWGFLGFRVGPWARWGFGILKPPPPPPESATLQHPLPRIPGPKPEALSSRAGSYRGKGQTQRDAISLLVFETTTQRFYAEEWTTNPGRDILGPHVVYVGMKITKRDPKISGTAPMCDRPLHVRLLKKKARELLTPCIYGIDLKSPEEARHARRHTVLSASSCTPKP